MDSLNEAADWLWQSVSEYSDMVRWSVAIVSSVGAILAAYAAYHLHNARKKQQVKHSRTPARVIRFRTSRSLVRRSSDQILS